MIYYLTFAGPIIISVILCGQAFSYTFSSEFMNFLAIYFLFFSIGYILLYKKIKHFTIKKLTLYLDYKKVIIICCFYLLLKILVFDLFSDINRIVSSFQRNEVGTSFPESVIDYLFYAFAYFSYPVRINKKISVNILPMIILIVMEFIAASRAVIMVSVLFMMATTITQKKNQRVNLVVIQYIILMCVLFLIIGFLRGSFENIEILKVVMIYIFGGLMAFDYVLMNNISVQSIVNIFPIVAKISAIFDPGITYNSYAYPLPNSNIPTNIYTVFREVYNDLGQSLGVPIFALGHGLLTKLPTAHKFEHNLYTSDITPYALIITFNLYFLFYPIFLFSFIYLLIIGSLFLRIKAQPQPKYGA